MTRFVHEVRLLLKRPRPANKPFVVAFTGHSQGGASATYAAWFVSKHLREEIRQGRVVVYCISFASPMVRIPFLRVGTQFWENMHLQN